MADIELVIKIPEEVYEDIQYRFNKKDYGCGYLISSAIVFGTPLPKGHGRLIDADALPLNAIDDANYGSNYIHIAPTIVEAIKIGHCKDCDKWKKGKKRNDEDWYSDEGFCNNWGTMTGEGFYCSDFEEKEDKK